MTKQDAHVRLIHMHHRERNGEITRQWISTPTLDVLTQKDGASRWSLAFAGNTPPHTIFLLFSKPIEAIY